MFGGGREKFVLAGLLAATALFAARLAAADTLHCGGSTYATYSGILAINDNPPAPGISRTGVARGFTMIDTWTGAGSVVSVTGGDMTARDFGRPWLVAVNTGTVAIDQTLGVRQMGTGSKTQNLAALAPISEPETYPMLLAGLGLMAFVARRRRQNLAA